MHKTVADNQLEHVVLSFGLVQYFELGNDGVWHVEPSAAKAWDVALPVQSGVS